MILIYGKGKTGKAVADFLSEKNIPFIIRDDNDFKEEELKNVNQIVVSPGIPFFHKIFRLAKRKNIEIVGDIEFAFRFYKGFIFAITGTDGKSTTTKILADILEDEEPFIGGNFGNPFIKARNKNPAILELSSFQIYSTRRFKPDIAVFLNISIDHLDWHKKKKHYILSKYKLLKNLKESSKAILNYDQKEVKEIPTKAKKYFFSLEKLPENIDGIYFNGKEIIIQIDKKESKIDISDFKLPGVHNIQNLMAASLAATLYGYTSEKIQEKIKTIMPLPYRIQYVKTIKGIDFYNDSKSTTVQSIEKAIDSFKDKDVILIAGGIYKGGDFSILNKKKNIKRIILIGRDKYIIGKMLDRDVIYSQSLEEAVKVAFSTAEKNDVILFSPGCSSFDMFKNYIDRGETFNKIVESLDK